MSIRIPQIVALKMPFSTKRNQYSLEECLLLGLGSGNERDKPETHGCERKCSRKDGDMSKGCRSQLEWDPAAKSGTISASKLIMIVKD